MVENLVSSKNLLPRIKRHMLSYPTHFLKIGVVYFGFVFFQTNDGDPNLYHDEMFFIHYFLQTKHNFCILFIFVVIVADNLLFHEKSPFLNGHHYSNNLLFSNQKLSV